MVMSVREILKSSLLIIAVLGFAEYCFAQPLRIDSELDTSQILIGDQVYMNVTVEFDEDLALSFPEYQDTIIGGIEVVSSLPLDTVTRDQGKLTVRQRVLVSSFDSGAYMIPSGPFVTGNGDTAWGRKMFLSVNTMAIDTTKGFADIKLPYTAPVTFEEILPYLWLGILALALLGGGVYVYLVYKRKKEAQRPKIVIPSDPPHIIAYRELDRLKEQKLWQQEKYKLYYSRLSEIIRQYIEHKFMIPALEQTSDEILRQFRASNSLKSDSFLLLQNVLQTADLAKFAKAEPVPEQNEQNFKDVFDFVSHTKLANLATESTPEAGIDLASDRNHS